MDKKLFLATAAALAFSGPVRAAEPLPPPPPPIFTWTGPYIGGQIGAAWASSTFDLLGFNPKNTDLFVISSSNSPSGVVGGAHVGYLYQINQFVIGIEGSVDGTSLRANEQFFLPAFIANHDVISAHGTADVQGTVRGKLGFAWDRVLIYGTGGVAFGGFSSNLFLNGLTPESITFPIGNQYFSNTLTGWTAGGGLQYAVTDNWWVFAEYRYTDFGSFNNTLPNAFPPDVFAPAPAGKLLGKAFVNNNTPHLRENQVQAGFSYRFNLLPPPPPVVAKY
jgi:outer membrane immunogenic protein